MKSPITGKEMKNGQERRNMTYRNEIFSVLFNYFVCEKSGEKFEDEHFAELNYNIVVSQYKVRHHIHFPEKM